MKQNKKKHNKSEGVVNLSLLQAMNQEKSKHLRKLNDALICRKQNNPERGGGGACWRDCIKESMKKKTTLEKLIHQALERKEFHGGIRGDLRVRCSRLEMVGWILVRFKRKRDDILTNIFLKLNLK